MRHFLFVLIVLLGFVNAQEKPKDEYDIKQDNNFEEVKKAFPSIKNVKTANFYINYTTSTPADFPKTLENLFALFKKILGIAPNEKVFNGRLEIYLWEKREEFLKFAGQFDQFNANAAGGYFTLSRLGWPRVNMPLESGASGVEANQARNLIVLFHEGTHAMFSQYISEIPLPTWINEGLADYFAFSFLNQYYPKLASNDSSKKRHIQYLKSALPKNRLRSFRQLFHQEGTGGGGDIEAYALGWCMSSFLIKNYKSQTIQFVKKIKQSSELSNGSFQAATREELEKKMKDAAQGKQKVLEKYFEECFKMNIDQFGEIVYSQLKKTPEILDRL